MKMEGEHTERWKIMPVDGHDMEHKDHIITDHLHLPFLEQYFTGIILDFQGIIYIYDLCPVMNHLAFDTKVILLQFC